MASSIQNILMARSADTGGLYSVQYWNGLPVREIRGMRGADPDRRAKFSKDDTRKNWRLERGNERCLNCRISTSLKP
jgi:hypothetical protein